MKTLGAYRTVAVRDVTCMFLPSFVCAFAAMCLYDFKFRTMQSPALA